MTFEIDYDKEKSLIIATTYGEFDFDDIRSMSIEIFSLLMKANFKCKVIVDHTHTPLSDVNELVLEQIIGLTKELENQKTVRIAVVVNKLKDLFFVTLWKSNAKLLLNTKIDVFFTLEDALDWMEI